LLQRHADFANDVAQVPPANRHPDDVAQKLPHGRKRSVTDAFD
jgi:hypothetical protein